MIFPYLISRTCRLSTVHLSPPDVFVNSPSQTPAPQSVTITKTPVTAHVHHLAPHVGPAKPSDFVLAVRPKSDTAAPPKKSSTRSAAAGGQIAAAGRDPGADGDATHYCQTGDHHPGGAPGSA